MIICAVKDMKAQYFLQPTFQRSVADAIRSWQIVANDDKDSMVGKFPHDYRLYHLGEFDTITGKISVFEDSRDLGSAADHRTPRSSEPTLPFPQAQ